MPNGSDPSPRKCTLGVDGASEYRYAAQQRVVGHVSYVSMLAHSGPCKRVATVLPRAPGPTAGVLRELVDFQHGDYGSRVRRPYLECARTSVAVFEGKGTYVSRPRAMSAARCAWYGVIPVRTEWCNWRLWETMAVSISPYLWRARRAALAYGIVGVILLLHRR